MGGNYDITSSIVVPEGVSVYGSFDGSESEPGDRDFLSATIFDGNYQISNIVQLSSNCHLDGFIIQRGGTGDGAMTGPPPGRRLEDE